MPSPRRALGRPRTRSTAPARTGRRVDGALRARRLRTVALLLVALGVLSLASGVVARRVDNPPLTPVSALGTTSVPRVWFFQAPYVLFAQVPTARRPPSLSALRCEPGGGLQVPDQPADMTRYGSRVLDGTSLSASVLVGRSSGEATLTCRGRTAFSPLWLAPASSAPPFAPTAMVVVAFVLFVAAVLVNPGGLPLPRSRRRERRAPN